MRARRSARRGANCIAATRSRFLTPLSSPPLSPAIPGSKARSSVEKTAAALQSAWRAYHRGDFAAAVEEGANLGPIGANAANKAANIYATYLEDDDERKKKIFIESIERAEALQKAAPDFANAFYFHAQALGRYSQEISIAKALTQGLAGKVKASLDEALKLAPRHAEAHIALGAYHAEIVGKIGGMLAGLTYGASKEEALKHFDEALRLLPDSAIARVEKANGLVLLFGRSRLGRGEETVRGGGAGQTRRCDAMARRRARAGVGLGRMWLGAAELRGARGSTIQRRWFRGQNQTPTARFERSLWAGFCRSAFGLRGLIVVPLRLKRGSGRTARSARFLQKLPSLAKLDVVVG